MYNNHQQIITYTINTILQHLNTKIHNLQLLKCIPQYIHGDIITNINYAFQSYAGDAQNKQQQSAMKQQYLYQVKHMQKDSLMPKGIQKQSEQIDNVQELNESTNKKKKGLNNTRSSFNKSNIYSVDNSNRGSKISIISKYKNKNKKEDNQCISIQKQKQKLEDPQVQNLWKIKDIQISVAQKQRKQQQKKMKAYQQKRQNFQKQLAEKQYTFDFQGQPIINAQYQQKIKYHQIRYRMSLLDKKLRSNIKFRDGETNLHTQIKLSKKNLITSNQHSYSVQFNNLPLFQNSNNVDTSTLFGLPTQLNKCKLKQYKKYYGGKFSRLDKNINTIDISTEKNDQYKEIFTERRYLKDQDRSINQSMISYRSRIDHATKRRLALPKIHGKYCTLDRYQQS